MKREARRRIILGDLAMSDALGSGINIGGPKTNGQRSDVSDLSKRLGAGESAIILREIGEQGKDRVCGTIDEDAKVQVGHPSSPF
jgi:hypothetical protein